MVDVDTFLTTLYVIVDDFCQSRAPRKRPAPKAALSDSEVIALAIFARWGRFSSERDFFRYAQSHLREAFSPPCPIARSSIGWCAPRAWASHRGGGPAPAGAYAGCPRRRRSLRSFGCFGHARSEREAKGRGMASWLRRHWMVQQSGVVRRLLPARRRRPHGSDHRLWLRLRQYQGPAVGRNVLRPAGSTRL